MGDAIGSDIAYYSSPARENPCFEVGDESARLFLVFA
jgi:hypothetical protein